jgi:cellulose biosynthesis protein BcsQ
MERARSAGGEGKGDKCVAASNVNPMMAGLFEQLFARPSVQAMLDLSWQDFEQFVAHVFTCAGYTVEHVGLKQFPNGPGVDLNLYTAANQNKPAVRVEVRRWAPTNLLNFQNVADFVGVLAIAGNIPGYLVTTSGFNGNAHLAAAKVGDKVRLIDGPTLVRYITYVGGSRLNGAFDGVSLAPTQPTSPAWLFKGSELAQTTRRPPRHTRVLAVANTKGGVAKTTTALNIGFALADQPNNQRVLLMDLDGQASLTRSLPRPLPPELSKAEAKIAPPPPDTAFVTDYLRNGTPLSALVRETRFKNLSLVPAQRDLYRLQFAGAERAKAELRFAQDVRSLTPPSTNNGATVQPYDWIVLDTPAGDTFYARAALAAADHILIPAFAETFAVQGVDEILKMAATMGALMGTVAEARARILGCLITRWKPGKMADQALANLRVALTNERIKIYNMAIPADDRIETAHQGTGGGGLRSIFRLTASMGPAATKYDEFVKAMVSDVSK